MALVAVARTLFVPALSLPVTVNVLQVSQLPVGPNGAPIATAVPLTVTVIGRVLVAPLAYRNARPTVPALAALTVNSTYPPATLV